MDYGIMPDKATIILAIGFIIAIGIIAAEFAYIAYYIGSTL